MALRLLRAAEPQDAATGTTSEQGESALTNAAARGDLTAVEMLLAAQAPVDGQGPRGWTALGWAARRGHAAIVQTLVASGANADRVNDRDDSALIVAIRHNHTGVIDVLLDGTKVDVNVVNKESDSALVLACRNPQCEGLVERLVRAGACVNWALWRAVEDSDAAMVQRLLCWVQDMTRIDSPGLYNEIYQPLTAASEKGNADIVRLLLDAGADVNATDDENSALILASANGHVGIVKMLLAVSGVDLEYQEENDCDTALLKATWSGHMAIVELLIAAGANLHHANYHGRTALIQAVRQGHVDLVEMLLGLGVDVEQADCAQSTPLLYAASEANAAILEMLLTTGNANIHHTNVSNESVLYICAARRGLETNLAILLAHGANINHARIDGATALMMACRSDSGPEYSRSGMAKALLAAGADIQLTDSHGYSAFLRAASHDEVAILEMLLARGADVNQVNRHDGRTALMLAAINGHVDVVATLLGAGANGAHVDASNQSALTATMDAKEFTTKSQVRSLLRSLDM